MIELRVYCRQLYHSGIPQIIVKVQVEDSVQSLLQKDELFFEEPSFISPDMFTKDLLTKVKAIFKNAARA
jgi:hypothetical protein